MTASIATPTRASRPTPRTELCGDGIRRDHRTACTGHRCDCPYSFWLPRTTYAKRERGRVYGTLADARRAKKKAHDAAAQHRRTQTNQRAGIIAMPTLDDWLEQAMQREWGQNRPATRERRRIDYRRVQPTFGTQRIDRITVPAVHAWLYKLIDAEGNRRSIQAAYECLRELLTLAVRHQLLPDNAAKHVRYPVAHMQVGERKSLTLDQYRQLLDACDALADRTLIRVLCEAGLRRGEATALQAGDLDLDHGFIHVQRRHYRCDDGRLDIDTPKSRRTRLVAINPSLADDLRAHLRASGEVQDESPVWTRCNHHTAHQPASLSDTAVYKVLKRVATEADLVPEGGKHWISPHILRATGASIAVASGVSPHIAQHQLGHANLATTYRYLRLPMTAALHQIGAVFE